MPPREYPLGLDGASLWPPFQRAKDLVELYPAPPQEPGCQVSMIRHDPDQGLLDVELAGLSLPSACPRFASRACPRMESMGHEPAQASCNYWDYPGMAGFAPGVELYPEWQRFDCHKFYPLFQAHLVGAALARQLGCRLRLIAPDADAALLAVYASMSSSPASFRKAA